MRPGSMGRSAAGGWRIERFGVELVDGDSDGMHVVNT